MKKKKASDPNKRFSCRCGGQFASILNSRNRTGKARMRQYACNRCTSRLNTVEVPVEADLRSGASADAVLRKEILETASPQEIIEALKFLLL